MTQKWFQRTASIVCIVLMCAIAACGGGGTVGTQGLADGEQSDSEQGALSRGTNKPGDFGYRRNEDKTGIIISYYTGTGSDIVIPDTIEELPVIAIGTVFSENTEISSVAIPDTVTEISESAFQNCTNLGSVKLPAGLKSIGVSAFRGCTALSSVEFPAGLETIGGSAFRGCNALTTLQFPAALTSIGAAAFYECTNLTGAQLSESLSTIGSYAFYACYNLANLNVPASLANFPNASYERYSYAFALCDKLPAAVRDQLIARGYVSSYSNW